MFVANDVANALGYEKPQNAIATHCKSGDALNYGTAYIPHSNGVGGTNVIIIGESNVYRLILHSHLPFAEKFQDWVFDEILPSIRKHGGYLTPAKTEELLMNPDLIIQMATSLKEERAKTAALQQNLQMLEGERELLQIEVKQLAPKAEYTDEVLQSTSTYTMTQLAKEMGLSAQTLEKKLHGAGVIFRQSGQWLLYAKYQDKGYAKTRTHRYTHSNGTIGTNAITVWTERGRAFIHQLRRDRSGAL
jgi:prophage antirepressor-like protein